MPPLDCYGLEHDAQNERCAVCPHAAACVERMGDREGRVPVHKLRFMLVPARLRPTKLDVPVMATDFKSTYAICHQQVFGSVTKEDPSRAQSLAVKYAKRAGCDMRMYILTNMTGHALAHPDEPFYAGFLADGRALLRVKTYMEICAQRYGGLSDAALGMVTDTKVSAFELNHRMQRSEALAGTWIIQYKLRCSGNAVVPMLTELELKLDPNWLAIEPAYAETVDAHLDEPGMPTSLRDKRHTVCEAHARMKKNMAQATGNFRARERAFPAVLMMVLSKFGYSTDDFEAPDVPIEDSLKLWSRLGLAIQHYECMKYLDGQRSACVDSGITMAQPAVADPDYRYRKLLEP